MKPHMHPSPLQTKPLLPTALYILPTILRVFLFPSRPLPSAQQCRSIHLYYTTTAKTPNGNHRAKNFRSAASLYPENVRIDLYYQREESAVDPDKSSSKYLIQKDIPLAQVLETHLKPGVCLVPLQTPENNKISSNSYVLHYFDTETFPWKRTRKVSGGALGRGAAEMHFHGEVPNHHLIHTIRNAYFYLKEGYRVELHVHPSPTKRSQEPPPFDQVINKHKHLYPEVLLKAMPECSGIIVEPQTSYIVSPVAESSTAAGSATKPGHPSVAWVVAPPIRNRKKELQKPPDITDRFRQRRALQIWLAEQGIRPPLSAQIAKLFLERFKDVWYKMKKQLRSNQKP